MTVKARMLKLLEQHENELISGEAAAADGQPSGKL